jgi:hypothetical protein
MVAIAAGTADVLAYLAGQSPALDEFGAVVANFTNVYAEAAAEVRDARAAACMHMYARACARARACWGAFCARACVRACACVRAWMRACVCACLCECLCVRACVCV